MDDVADEWTEVAGVWSRYWAPAAEPAQRAIMAAAGVGAGSRVLDVGCGSGEFLALLRSAGATVAGCDPSSGMIDLARARNPGADIRLAVAEQLPWPDDAFDLVTAVNALQFVDDRALPEFARVGRSVAIANWADDDLNDLSVIERALQGDDYEPGDESREAGYLTSLLTAAGFTSTRESTAPAPMRLVDAAALASAFGIDPATSGEVLAAAAPFLQPDGGYLLRNTFRWAVGERT